MSGRTFGCVALVVLAIVVTAESASAQSAFAGLVRDESGAVLPGVTVEASSPVLIERTRSVLTDDQGRYRVVDLRPGVYTLTFALDGFSRVARDGIELPANFVATVNVDLKVASLAETVTVSGASPLVDTCSRHPRRRCSHATLSTRCRPRATSCRLASWYRAFGSAPPTSAARGQWNSRTCKCTASISEKRYNWSMACR